ncbi:MAG TPA: ABC transporter permease subunit [Sporichthya sp.]|nr:ABC transporter permease subunit [Sporichthya sp.]
MNATVARLTIKGLLGRRRALLLMTMPALLLGLATLVRALAGQDDKVTAGIAGGLGVALFVPLLGVIAGTGAIGPEIDDGSIVYLLAKPLSRHSIATTKAVVAMAVIVVFAAVPALLAGLIMSGTDNDIALGLGVGAACGGIAYGALFLLLAVITRSAVLVGLIYALIWETLVGSFVPGARALSIAQWSGSITEAIIGKGTAKSLELDAAVNPGVGIPLLVLVTIGATWYAGRRLRTIRLAGDE